jgi:hypothetical protein
VHVIPLGDSDRQQVFIQACRERGARFISAGTFIQDIREKPDVIRATIEMVDAFFMNEEEASSLYGSLETIKTTPGKLIFVTLGEKGAVVIQGETQTQLPVIHAKILDPTGAGDTFCGATLANLLQGDHPVMAARKAMVLAAAEIEQVGPQALFDSRPLASIPLDERVRIDDAQVEKVSEVVKNLDDAAPFDFTGEFFPPVGHPAALDYFFASTLQQFSFWETKDGKYDYPLIAPIDGKNLKGSSYLYYAFTRPLDSDPDFLIPARQAALKIEDMLALFRADDGSDPMPALGLHLDMARRYGRDMLALGITPQKLIEQAKDSGAPLKTFLGVLDHIGGYKEDPIRKKSNLLALCLSQRPEKFLTFGSGESVKPVVDYHAQRACLRTGLVNVVDPELRSKLINRQLVNADEEWAVRFAGYRVQQAVVELSGKGLGAVDWFFFNYIRSHCPEMTEPICAECALEKVCLQRKEFFQPVFRTTFY